MPSSRASAMSCREISSANGCVASTITRAPLSRSSRRRAVAARREEEAAFPLRETVADDDRREHVKAPSCEFVERADLGGLAVAKGVSHDAAPYFGGFVLAQDFEHAIDAILPRAALH